MAEAEKLCCKMHMGMVDLCLLVIKLPLGPLFSCIHKGIKNQYSQLVQQLQKGLTLEEIWHNLKESYTAYKTL